MTSPTNKVQVTPDLTRKIADLARLELTESEVMLYTTQMQTTLGYIDQLTQVNTEGVTPLVHPLEIETPMREDIVRKSPQSQNGKPKMIENAPEVMYEGFKVPPII